MGDAGNSGPTVQHGASMDRLWGHYGMGALFFWGSQGRLWEDYVGTYVGWETQRSPAGRRPGDYSATMARLWSQSGADEAGAPALGGDDLLSRRRSLGELFLIR